MSAIEARNVAQIGFYDCSSVSIGALMGMMECELSQLQRGAEFHCFRRGAQGGRQMASFFAPPVVAQLDGEAKKRPPE